MQETINVRIKTFGNPPRPATTKVFLDKKAFGRHARALEPGEIIEMPFDAAKEMLDHLPGELEMTLDPANRPLAFENQHQAAITSTQNTMINRSEQVQAAHQSAVAQMQEEMRKRNDLLAREEAVARREAELGLGVESGVTQATAASVEPTLNVLDALDDEPVREGRNNAISPEELEKIREDGKRAEEAARAQAANPPKRKPGRPRKNPKPEVAG